MEQALQDQEKGSQPHDSPGRRSRFHRIPHVANLTPAICSLPCVSDRDLKSLWITSKSPSRNFSENSRVTTKSQLGANRVQSTNSVNQSILKNLNNNRKTAQVRGLLNIVLVPKGGLEPPRVTSHAPQTCASTSSATSAHSGRFSKT